MESIKQREINKYLGRSQLRFTKIWCKMIVQVKRQPLKENVEKNSWYKIIFQMDTKNVN